MEEEKERNDVLFKRLRIPRERVGVLIGKHGEVKRKIEEALGVRLRIKEDGEVTIEGPENLADNIIKAGMIVEAIGYGFSPDKAMKLLNEDYVLRVIDLSRYARHRNDLVRIKGRIIGEKGKARRIIEETTETHISVYEKYVAIIGPLDNVAIAEEAIMKLIRGARHATVYDWLYEQRSLLKYLEYERRFGSPATQE